MEMDEKRHKALPGITVLISTLGAGSNYSFIDGGEEGGSVLGMAERWGQGTQADCAPSGAYTDRLRDHA